MHRFRSVLLATVLAASSLPAHAAYVVTEITRAGAFSTSIFDINNSGLMVGFTTTGDGVADTSSSFLYDGTSFVDLTGPEGAISTTALGISDSGIVVGAYRSEFVDDGAGGLMVGGSTGFIYSGGTYTSFSVPGALQTELRGISPDGRYLTGYYVAEDFSMPGFVYDTLLGTFQSTSLADSQLTITQGVTNGGIAVGSDFRTSNPVPRPGFIFDATTGVRTEALVAGARITYLRGIAEDGTLGGRFVDASGQHGFIGSLDTFTQIDVVGATGTFGEGVNDAGDLVGFFLRQDGTIGGFLARAEGAVAVPEPDSAALLAAALGALAFACLTRRRRSTHAGNAER